MRTFRSWRAPRPRLLVSAVTGLATAACLGLVGADTTQATPSANGSGEAADPVGPPQDNFLSAFAYTAGRPTAVPTGANDWDCRPSAARPRPVVLVHGTFENRYANWAGLAPKLKDAGYCVYALNYGGSSGPLMGTGDIPTSARQLAAFVDRVRPHPAPDLLTPAPPVAARHLARPRRAARGARVRARAALRPERPAARPRTKMAVWSGPMRRSRRCSRSTRTSS